MSLKLTYRHTVCYKVKMTRKKKLINPEILNSQNMSVFSNVRANKQLIYQDYKKASSALSTFPSKQSHPGAWPTASPSEHSQCYSTT